MTDGETSGRETMDREARDAALSRRLRSAAHGHRPDRERMLARVERGMAGGRDGARAPRTPRARRGCEEGASWLRVAGTTAAVAGVFAAGGYGVATAVRGDDVDARTVATTPSTPPAASVPAPPPAESDRTKRPPRRPASGSPPASGTQPAKPARPPAAPRPPASSKPPRATPGAGLVRTDGRIDPGSNPYWSQSDITVGVRKPLTSLTVELRVARSGEVADTGNWHSLPVEDFDVSVRERDGYLRYRWTLRAGRTVPAGQYVFAGQYNHQAGERDERDDSYAVEAGTSGEQGEWKGDVGPASK